MMGIKGGRGLRLSDGGPIIMEEGKGGEAVPLRTHYPARSEDKDIQMTPCRSSW